VEFGEAPDELEEFFDFLFRLDYLGELFQINYLKAQGDWQEVWSKGCSLTKRHKV
jgi:hypothetical protein